MTTMTHNARTHDAPAVDASPDAAPAADEALFGHRSVQDDREYAVLLAAFETDEEAGNARECLAQLGAGGAEIRNVATFRTDACGVVHVERLTDGSVKKGVAAGMLGGLATGMLLPPPMVISILSLGLAGAVVGRLRYEYRKAGTGAALLGAIRPNTAAVLAVVKAEDVTHAKSIFTPNTALRTTYVDGKAAGHLSEAARRIG
jgi:hypothetical protein